MLRDKLFAMSEPEIQVWSGFIAIWNNRKEQIIRVIDSAGSIAVESRAATIEALTLELRMYDELVLQAEKKTRFWKAKPRMM